MSSDSDCANPLWLSWVKEWWDVARERNSKGVTTYKHAFDSLKACPIVFTHPSELQQLKGFGPGLCGRLTDELRKYCEDNGLPMPTVPRKKKGSRRAAGADGDADEDEDAEVGPSNRAKKPRKTKEYVPAYRTGPYALILALASQDKDGPPGLPKADLIELAQPHCDASFSAPSDPTKFYTAWNSLKTLLTKELVYERGRPLKRYALTDEGWDVALRVKQIAEARGVVGTANGAPPRAAVDGPVRNREPLVSAPVPDLAESMFVGPEEDGEGDRLPPTQQPTPYRNVVANGPAAGPDEAALPVFTPMRLPPGSFQVHLVLDVREVRAKTDRDYMQDELAKRGVKPIMRSLELGDAVWVAKCHDAGLLSQLGAEGDELVLDYIAERKRLDDLVSSVKDGRFHEQKFRLRRSGVRNVIYIVEEISMDSQHFSRYEEVVESAMASTQVVNGYFLKRTSMMDETIAYLARMTKLLKKRYEARPLQVIPTRVLTPQNYLPLLAHLRERGNARGGSSHAGDFYISYPAFASLASKSDIMTLRDVYLKMLMCSKGITGEKAMEIQKRWRTPYDFVKAFEACGSGPGTDEVRRRRKHDLVFEQMGGLVGRKKMTKPFSQTLAEVWGDG